MTEIEAGVDTSPGMGASRQLNEYWTAGAGLAKWRGSPKPWTTLYNLLKQYMSDAKAKGLATEYYVRVFGHGPSKGEHHHAAAQTPRETTIMANLVTVPGVELMKTGKWDVSTGNFTVTPELISAAIDAHQAAVLRKPVIRLGHNDSRFSGEPAVGYVDNLRASADGNTLLGDLVGMPQWLGDIMASAYPDRSIEGLYDYTAPDGTDHGFILTGLALLGVTRPGVESLQSLQDVARLYDIAAAGQVGGTAVEINISASKDPSANEAEVNKEKEGAMPTLNEGLAQKLGVSADADDETILKAVDEALAERAADEPPPVTVEPQPEPVAAAAGEPTGEQITAAAAKMGLTMIDTTVLASLQAKAEAGEAARAQQLAEADDRIIKAALSRGKITPASEKTWRAELARNHDSVAVLLETMPENKALAVAEIGHSFSAEDSAIDAEMEHTLALITGQPVGKDA